MTQPSSSASKRPRHDASADDTRAECPFTVRLVDPREKELKVKSKKRRKRGHNSATNGNHPDDDDAARKILQQCAPFEPKGEFETHSTMDVHYVVEPAKQWADMTRYNSFVLNGVKYYCEGFIYVANESSIERQKHSSSSSSAAATAGGGSGSAGTAGGSSISAGASSANPGARDPRKRSEDDWVARILEIRASDEHHVYARVFWMYWPDELPAGTHYGKRQVQGRQPYHGASELIASNHMDIINVVSVTSMASVNHLNEDKDDDVQSALYWRQALDVRNMELSSIENVCDCGQPANPDKMLVGCGDENCAKWIHEDCLKHYALMRVYERLGRDKPHITEKKKAPAALDGSAGKPDTNSSGNTDDVTEPLSPRESGGAVSAQHSIDVKADSVEVQGQEGDEDEDLDVRGGEANGSAARTNGHSGSSGEPKDVAVRNKKRTSGAAGAGDASVREVTPPAGTDGSGGPKTKGGAGASATGLATPTPAATTPAAAGGTSGPSSASASKPSSAAATKGKAAAVPTLQSFDGKKKPYDKLFEATLLLTPLESAAPTMIEIRDLRSGVSGGDKVWLEPAECPLCGSAIR